MLQELGFAWVSSVYPAHAVGTPDENRRGGALRNLGPVERQLRGLLWKHAVGRYNYLSLRTPELVDLLRQKVLKEESR